MPVDSGRFETHRNTYSASPNDQRRKGKQKEKQASIMMSTQLPRPTSNTTSSSNSTNSTTSFAGNMDTYTLSMYEHTKRLMAAAQIPYGSPASLLTPSSSESPAAGTSSDSVENTLASPKSDSLPQLRSN
ncbi:hypothetical protein CGRA01v4_13849 [Colletotrichum graminicola]|nr:hypothetical protein CGRA01v4_13849 [Colletotrichum graminicola]